MTRALISRTAVRCVAIVLAALTTSAVFAIRPAETSQFISPTSSSGRSYFAGRHFIFAGGVVPRGRVSFYRGDVEIPISKLTLDISRGPQNTGSMLLVAAGASYSMPNSQLLACPLARFVERDGVIAYTVPVVAEDPDYFRRNGLVSGRNGYVAREFHEAGLEPFLDDLDFHTETVDLPNPLQQQIISDSNRTSMGRKGTALRLKEMGTYVNADFHVQYRAYLVDDNGRREIDIAGVPLRYHWDIGSDDKGVVSKVELFKYPSKHQAQERAILFFQYAAVLRQFRTEKATAFKVFTEKACSKGNR